METEKRPLNEHDTTEATEATEEIIAALLSQHEIDLSQYGQGSAKSLASLVKEVNEGEAALTTNDRGELIRCISVAKANITYRMPDGRVLRLKEDRQEFTDGRVRQRDTALGDGAISEKMHAGEDPTGAIVRAIRDEELKIDTGFTVSDQPHISTEEVESPSFPGLMTQYTIFRFGVALSDEAFRPEGYTETQPDKTTYWVWVVDDEQPVEL